ncbi:MAG: phenylalanine--tRNA ligase subunit beta, partial [Halanaerobiales bacterium]
KINYPEINLKNVSEENINDKINVTIDDPDLCPRYTARLVKNVKIGPSPEWMQQRLQAAGIRPINNVVDITNYVLLEYNQPLHAFDYDKIGEKEIIVRRAREDEELITLDDEKRKLNNEILIIADRDKPVALAGVMGGANSEVTENTQNILIESAYFKPANIRKTARRLGLSSESSYRFERGVDIENLIEANNRAAQLMQEYADAEIVEGVIDNYPGSYSKTTVSLRSKRVNEILGIELDAETMKNLLIKLEFDVSLENLSENDTKMRVDVPSYRNDIEREADIIEEIARMYGYNKIPVTHSESKQEGKKTNPQKIREQIRNIMTASGLDEIITFSLMGKEIYDRLNISRDNKLTKWVEIKNPLNKAFSVMRTSLIPNMIQTLSQNSKRQLQELRFFEIGKVFYDKGRRKRPEEVEMLAGGSMGYTEDIWNNSAPDFFYLKGVIENLFRRLNLDNLNFHKANKPFLHPGRTTEIFYKNKKVGFLGEILPDLIKEFDLSDHTALFQIDLNIIKNEVEPGEQRYVSLPRYPAVSRDLAIVVEKNLPSVKIMNAIENTAGDLLKDVKLFDLYQGEQIEKDSKSLAYKLLFQAEDRTLTDEEVNKLFKNIIENLKNEFNATIRN